MQTTEIKSSLLWMVKWIIVYTVYLCSLIGRSRVDLDSSRPQETLVVFLSFLLLQYRSFTTVLKEGLERSHLIVLPGTCLCATLTSPRLSLSVLTGSVTRNQGSGGNSFMCFDKRFYVRGECLRVLWDCRNPRTQFYVTVEERRVVNHCCHIPRGC